MIYLSELTDRYRIVNDEAWHHERPEVRNPDRRSYEQIPCRGGGFIYLYSEDPPTLGLYSTQVKSARAIFNHIEHLPGVSADFGFDGEAAIFFPPEILALVAEMAGARKKRHGRKLSAEAKSKLAEAGIAYRFNGNSTGLQEENPDQI